MKIQWLGHSCFYLISESGVRVVTDPFDPKVPFPPPAVEADIVTVSHQHGDHNYTQAVKGGFTVIDQPGSQTACGVEVTGVETFHDEAGGTKRGKNIVFSIRMDGLNVVHCGDLGHPLTEEQARAIGPADVLLVPVGGFYTIDPAAAMQVKEALHARLTVPMHFKTGALNFPIETVEGFLKLAGPARQAGSTEITITADDLPEQPGVVVLDHP